jgi:hypothetical protein
VTKLFYLIPAKQDHKLCDLCLEEFKKAMPEDAASGGKRKCFDGLSGARVLCTWLCHTPRASL